jgi:hypothetical protein
MLFTATHFHHDPVNAQQSSLESVQFNFADIPIHAAPTFIETKLAINKPGDEYEQEADAMANKVMRMTEGYSSNQIVSLKQHS